MMHFKYNAEQIREELQRRADENNAAIAAWEAVAVNKKKNGEEFKNLNKALENAKEVYEYGFRRVVVYFSTPQKQYNSATIDVYGYLDELPESDPRRAEYVKQFVRQKYDFTAAEVRARISTEIETRKARAIEYEKQIAVCADAVATFREKVAEALRDLDAAARDRGRSSTPFVSSSRLLRTVYFGLRSLSPFIIT